MRVVIASASHSAHLSGVERHAMNLSRALCLQEEIQSVHLVAAPWQRNLFEDTRRPENAKLSLHISDLGRNAFLRNLWYYTHLPQVVHELRADIVHFAFPMPLNASAFHCSTVVSLHDMYPFSMPENFGFPKVLVNRMVLHQCLNAAHAIACVSRSTYSELFNYHPSLALSKASVIPNAVESPPRYCPEDSIARLTKAPFFLCVAQHRRNKNILLVLSVFRSLLDLALIAQNTRLVIVGIAGPETPRIRHFIARSGMTAQVVLTSGLEDHELQALYGACDVLLAPSTAEGFGLPVVEAILTGCRVVCSNIPAHREFGEGHCRFVSLGPGDEARLTNSIVAALREKKPPPVTLPQLTSEYIGQSYLALYRKFVPSATSSRQQGYSFTVQEKGHAPL